MLTRELFILLVDNKDVGELIYDLYFRLRVGTFHMFVSTSLLMRCNTNKAYDIYSISICDIFDVDYRTYTKCFRENIVIQCSNCRDHILCSSCRDHRICSRCRDHMSFKLHVGCTTQHRYSSWHQEYNIWVCMLCMDDQDKINEYENIRKTLSGREN
jgi:hypothetical protein